MLEHSWLLGHLPFVYGWTRQNPKDTHIFRLMYHVLDNYQRLFPGQETLPPVLYLDLWPIETPLMIVFDPAVTAQFTQETSLPKHSVLTEIMIPLTKGKDLNTISGEPWRYWRSRFNPGFSARNTMALLPEVIEEIVVFAGKLDNYAGPDGQWGRAFQMETETVNLTFDVIGRAILYGHSFLFFPSCGVGRRVPCCADRCASAKTGTPASTSRAARAARSSWR